LGQAARPAAASNISIWGCQEKPWLEATPAALEGTHNSADFAGWRAYDANMVDKGAVEAIGLEGWCPVSVDVYMALGSKWAARTDLQVYSQNRATWPVPTGSVAGNPGTQPSGGNCANRSEGGQLELAPCRRSAAGGRRLGTLAFDGCCAADGLADGCVPAFALFSAQARAWPSRWMAHPAPVRPCVWCLC